MVSVKCFASWGFYRLECKEWCRSECLIWDLRLSRYFTPSVLHCGNYSSPNNYLGVELSCLCWAVWLGVIFLPIIQAGVACSSSTLPVKWTCQEQIKLGSRETRDPAQWLGLHQGQSVTPCRILRQNCYWLLWTVQCRHPNCPAWVFSFVIYLQSGEIVGERDSEEIPGAVTDKEGCNERTSL